MNFDVDGNKGIPMSETDQPDNRQAEIPPHMPRSSSTRWRTAAPSANYIADLDPDNAGVRCIEVLPAGT